MELQGNLIDNLMATVERAERRVEEARSRMPAMETSFPAESWVCWLPENARQDFGNTGVSQI